VRIWATKILCSGFQKSFKHASVAMIAGAGLGEGRVAFEHCYPDWGLHVGEADKGIGTVTAYYVKLRLIRCGLAVRRLFQWLLCYFWGCSDAENPGSGKCEFRAEQTPSPFAFRIAPMFCNDAKDELTRLHIYSLPSSPGSVTMLQDRVQIVSPSRSVQALLEMFIVFDRVLTK
jgi:hypothetical protein